MSRVSLARWSFSGVLLLGLVLAGQAAEDSLIRWQTDYLQAHKIRVERRMPMLVFLTMDGCPHCYRMMETTYGDKTIAHEIADTYVPIVINGTHQKELAGRFGVRMYPTTFIVGADNRVIDRIEGYVDSEQMQARLQAMSERQAARSAADRPTER